MKMSPLKLHRLSVLVTGLPRRQQQHQSILRRDIAADLEQAKREIEKMVKAQSRSRDFRVGVLPILKEELQINM